MILSLIALALAVAPSPAEREAIFRAAGFEPSRGRWLTCDGERPLKLQISDLNRDGWNEALVTDVGIHCYGNTGTGFAVLTKSPQGRWIRLYRSPGMPAFLKSHGNGWPEIEVGLPGFCFPILRFNGRAYAVHRREYHGKACTR